MAGDYVVSGRVAEAGLGELHELLERVGAEHPGLDRTGLLLLETALIEIAGNTLEHGTPPGGIRYEFALEVRDDELRGVFTDDGDPVVLPPAPTAAPDPLAESGRGLALAGAALSELRYERQGGRNTWFLTRRTDERARSPR